MKAKKRKLPDFVDLIIFDFDGVFTDNKVILTEDGIESVVCDRRDGLGIDMLRKLNLNMLILTTEINNVVMYRANKLKIPIEKGCENKEDFLNKYFKINKIKSKNTIYIGNDLNDLKAMRLVGFSVAPADSHNKILAEADLILERKGGDGAVRELAELLINHLK